MDEKSMYSTKNYSELQWKFKISRKMEECAFYSVLPFFKSPLSLKPNFLWAKTDILEIYNTQNYLNRLLVEATAFKVARQIGQCKDHQYGRELLTE